MVAPVDRGQDLDDLALLRAHASGDPMAFDQLVRRHRDRMWAVALRTLGDREEAADALQDALISAFRNAERFRGDAAVTTWLHRIVMNACFDRIRRRRAHPTVELPEIDTPAPHVDTDMVLDVHDALASLPDDQRAAIVLVDMEGFSVADAATVLDTPIGTVKSRCARGRARLAVMLGYLRNLEAPDGVSSVMPAQSPVEPPARPPRQPPTQPAHPHTGRPRTGEEA
jgi:RNA polymerase sigma-70 factor, ECF subfamily